MQHIDFPYTIRPVKGVAHTKIVEDFKGFTEGLVQIGPERFIMPAKYQRFADQIYNFEARPDDVWICSLPRTGTTWTQEMIWLICNNLDYETALKTPLNLRFPFLEMHTLLTDEKIAETGNILEGQALENFNKVMVPKYDMLSKMTTQRFIKTHLPIKLMPRNIMEVGAKIVYVARNPKDAVVSFYHFAKINGNEYSGDFETFARYFLDDLTIYTPFFKHVFNGWENRHRENVHFMFYEDSKFDLGSSLKELADFLRHPLKEEDLPKLIEHLSFEKVKKNPAINRKLRPSEKEANSVRRGQVGGNPEMTAELTKKFDEWAARNMAGHELKFPVRK